MRPRPLQNPKNPWARTHVDYGADDDLHEVSPKQSEVKVYEDHSRSILSRNDSPDLGFTYSINPYRGCTHACAYCYARPTHEYLDFGAGSDFDTQIVLKPEAAALLREAFEKPSWRGELLVFSGVTDCYQPLEASYGLTRACLEVCLAYRNPVAIITKAPLIERDLDLLVQLAQQARATVTLSIPFWDPEKARLIEPYVATPQRRVRTIARLAAAGIDVGVSVAPLIPGLNDEEIAPILSAAREAGATRAGTTVLRLPGSVQEVFTQRLQQALPLRAERVLHRIREVRGGALSSARFGERHTGSGVYAQVLEQLFANTARRLGFRETTFPHEDSPAPASTFRRPARGPQQLGLPGL